MAVAAQFSYLEPVRYSPRLRGKQKQCMDAGCQLVLCAKKKRQFYCVSQRLPDGDRRSLHSRIKGARVPTEWARTPDHPDGFKWRKVRRELPLRRKLLDVPLCPEGLWRD